jgi:hypothetical protein
MPISSETFDESNAFSNPKLVEFLMKNKANAYSLTELQQQFGQNVNWELFPLVSRDQVDQKYIKNDFYYRWKGKKK